MPEQQVDRIARSAPHRYKVYQIPKKASLEKRTIAQPAREVKSLQYWVLEHVLASLPVHDAATAYRPGSSILKNAEVHAQNSYLLKLDFRNFFPSIFPRDFRVLAEEISPGLSSDDIDLLSRILFWQPRGEQGLRLSIGAPTSPCLSNAVLFEFDTTISNQCREKKVTYTRYADDMAFSTNEECVLSEIHEAVKSVCRSMASPELNLNEPKTVYTSMKHRRRVTGLILANSGAVSLGRSRKREIRAAIHRFSLGKLDEKEISALGGLLSFAESIEPDFVGRMENHYGSEVLGSLKNRSRVG